MPSYITVVLIINDNSLQLFYPSLSEFLPLNEFSSRCEKSASSKVATE